MADQQRYLKLFGDLVSNLQSLECILRIFLLKVEKCPEKDYHLFNVGDKVPEDPFTNYDTLNNLISKYNAHAQQPGCEQIDTSVVDIRDLLAHGRKISFEPRPPWYIMKFSKPDNGNVTVTHSETIDDTWLSEKISLTFAQIEKAIALAKKLNLSGVGDLMNL